MGGKETGKDMLQSCSASLRGVSLRPLRLSPELESCRIPPDLPPEFAFERRMALF